jgi:hypothetical protein
MSEEYRQNSYDAVFSRMEAKLDKISSDISELKDNNKEVEKRVAALEFFRYYLAGIVAAGGVVAGIIGDYISSKIMKS